MKASRCPTACAARMLAMLTPVVFLVQCSMPPQEAWRYIQTNGLLTYWSSSRQSPPFGTGSSFSQRYAANPQRLHYGAVSRTGYAPNSYFSTLSPGSGSSSRYVPRSRSRSPSLDRRPDVKIPVEEPLHTQTPHIANTPPLVSSPPTPNGSTDAATPALPYGTAVPGRMNMVNSPFAGKTQLVDVSGMSAGQTVKCPYTGKLFKVPPTQQAANRVEPDLESKAEAPKLPNETQDGDKKP